MAQAHNPNISFQSEIYAGTALPLPSGSMHAATDENKVKLDMPI